MIARLQLGDLFKTKETDTRTISLTAVYYSSDAFIVNFEQISHLVLVLLLMTLYMQIPVNESLKAWSIS